MRCVCLAITRVLGAPFPFLLFSFGLARGRGGPVPALLGPARPCAALLTWPDLFVDFRRGSPQRTAVAALRL